MMTSEEKGIRERLLELADAVENCQARLRSLGLAVSARGLKMPIERLRAVANDNLGLRESVCVMDVVTGKVMEAIGPKGDGDA